MIRLSPNFSLDEFTFSETASRKGIDNTPEEDDIINLHLLAERMEDVRKVLNDKPIYVSSAFRGIELNDALGSKRTSAHIRGLACDFTCQRFGTPNEIVFAIINSDIPYDQVILEFDRWVHISFCEDEKTPRKQALVINKQGTMIYSN